jgi:tetratricopeptide (TPR) repeat protein
MIQHLILSAGLWLATSQAQAEGLEPSDILGEAKHRWLQGDLHGTITLLEPMLTGWMGPKGHRGDAAHFLLATAYVQRGDWNMAVRHFRIIRANKRALAPHSILEEARANLMRGQHWSLRKNCEEIREKWPNQESADECLLLLGDSYASTDRVDASWRHYDAWLARHPSNTRVEEVLLRKFSVLNAHSPEKARPHLEGLYLNHRYPTTDRSVLSMLEKAPALETIEQQGLRAFSLLRTGRLGEAWELFQKIQSMGTETPAAKDWIQNHRRDFSWRSRNFDFYADIMLDIHKKQETSEVAWKVFRAYVRGGEWDKAVDWGRASLRKYRWRGRWSGARDDLAQAEMFVRDYRSAGQRWSELKGRKAKFYSGFCHYMAGDYKIALQKLDKLFGSQDGWTVAGRYWSGKAWQKLGEEENAEAEFDLVRENDETGWYRLLLHPIVEQEGAQGWLDRTGHWGGGPRAALADLQKLTHPGQTAVSGPRQPSTPNPAASIDWAKLSWPLENQEQHSTLSAEWDPPVPEHIGSFPSSYSTEFFGDSEDLETSFVYIQEQLQKHYPELQACYDLIQAGFYPEAGRIIARVHDHWKLNYKSSLPIIFEDWRKALIYARAHHHVMLYTTGTGETLEDPEHRKAVERLNYPVVRPAEVWKHSQDFGLDPYVIYSIMRAESTYRDYVVSPAGAIGYIQVMPLTGAKVAYLLGEDYYNPKDLEDPAKNLRYGMFYFSKLLERFGGSFPFAVGSYNAGPHNMSRWYKNLKGHVDLDEFVEHIPYDETRIYTKKVSAYYAKYVDLYETAGAQVILPQPANIDDAEVIDF